MGQKVLTVCPYTPSRWSIPDRSCSQSRFLWSPPDSPDGSGSKALPLHWSGSWWRHLGVSGITSGRFSSVLTGVGDGESEWTRVRGQRSCPPHPTWFRFLWYSLSLFFMFLLNVRAVIFPPLSSCSLFWSNRRSVRASGTVCSYDDGFGLFGPAVLKYQIPPEVLVPVFYSDRKDGGAGLTPRLWCSDSLTTVWTEDGTRNRLNVLILWWLFMIMMVYVSEQNEAVDWGANAPDDGVCVCV